MGSPLSREDIESIYSQYFSKLQEEKTVYGPMTFIQSIFYNTYEIISTSIYNHLPS